MSADLLRRAAAKIRETAQGASPGPWSKHEAGDGTVSVVGPDVHFLAEVGAGVFPSVQRDAEHIATWSPDLAELVATLMDALASQYAAVQRLIDWQTERAAMVGGDGRTFTTHHDWAHPLLVLARRILGEDA